MTSEMNGHRYWAMRTDLAPGVHLARAPGDREGRQPPPDARWADVLTFLS
jgi:hypothetical protein